MISFLWLKKFFAGFYSDEPGMLMPAVPEHKEDDDLTAEQQRAAALKHQQANQADEGADDDLDLPPPDPSP